MPGIRLAPLLIPLAALAFCRPVTAAPEPSKAAKTRAALYHVETRTVLERRHWRVAADLPGKLIADRVLVPQGSSYNVLGSAPPMGQVLCRLTITFQPDSAMHTRCAANVVGYFYTKGPADIQKTLSKPFPFNSADNTKEIQDSMAEAEKQLTTKHPEYTAR